jgi:AcrR family transcriptional regulator
LSARDAILNAAETLFGEVGFDAATTREITRLSGVNKALMYYYFDNKNALLDSVLDRYFNKLNKILLQAMEGEGDLRGRLKRVIDVYVDFLQHNVNFSRIVQRESGAGRHMDEIFNRLSPLFQAGMATTQEAYPAARQGEMSAEQLLISFYGMIVSYFNFGPLLGRLMNTDLFSMKNVETRKKHLHWMLDIVVDELERQEKPEPE